MFATVVLGMGVDIPSIRNIIHVGPPRTIREYFQETGRAGRDGKQSLAVLYYNNRDIAKNREGMSDDIRQFCRLEDSFVRKFLLNCLDASSEACIGHLCCSYCESVCDCDDCLIHCLNQIDICLLWIYTWTCKINWKYCILITEYL